MDTKRDEVIALHPWPGDQMSLEDNTALTRGEQPLVETGVSKPELATARRCLAVYRMRSCRHVPPETVREGTQEHQDENP